jgi:hypothetical protein
VCLVLLCHPRQWEQGHTCMANKPSSDVTPTSHLRHTSSDVTPTSHRRHKPSSDVTPVACCWVGGCPASLISHQSYTHPCTGEMLMLVNDGGVCWRCNVSIYCGSASGLQHALRKVALLAGHSMYCMTFLKLPTRSTSAHASCRAWGMQGLALSTYTQGKGRGRRPLKGC